MGFELLASDLGYVAEPAPGPPVSLRQHLRAAERAYLCALLKRTRGRVNEACLIACVSRRTIARLLLRHKIDRRSFEVEGIDSRP